MGDLNYKLKINKFEMTTKKNQKGNKEGEKTYQIRPVFTKKFRPQVSSPFRQFLTIISTLLGSQRQNRSDCENQTYGETI